MAVTLFKWFRENVFEKYFGQKPTAQPQRTGSNTISPFPGFRPVAFGYHDPVTPHSKMPVFDAAVLGFLMVQKPGLVQCLNLHWLSPRGLLTVTRYWQNARLPSSTPELRGNAVQAFTQIAKSNKPSALRNYLPSHMTAVHHLTQDEITDMNRVLESYPADFQENPTK